MKNKSMKKIFKRLFNPHSYSIVLFFFVLIQLGIFLLDARPSTVTIGALSVPTGSELGCDTWLGGYDQGQHVHILIPNIDSPTHIILNKTIYPWISSPVFSLLYFYNITGSFSYTINVREQHILLSMQIISPLNETLPYHITVTRTAPSLLLIYPGIFFSLLWVGMVVVEFFLERRDSIKSSSENDLSSLQVAKPQKNRFWILVREELSSFNYAFFGLPILMFNIGSSYFQRLAITPEEFSPVSILHQYFNLYILYDGRSNFLVFTLSFIGLLYSRIYDELRQQDWHTKSFYSPSFLTVLARSTAAFLVLFVTWSLFFLLKLYHHVIVSFGSESWFYPVEFSLLLFTLVLFLFLMPLLYYSFESWLPPKLKWFLPVVVYLIFFNLGDITGWNGVLFIVLYSFTDDILVYSIILFIEVFFVLGLCWQSQNYLKLRDPREFKYYQFFRS